MNDNQKPVLVCKDLCISYYTRAGEIPAVVDFALTVLPGETIGIVGFYDYGFIGSDAFPSEGSGDSQSGAGIGVRYQTPIGPIRFDVAVPVNGPNDSNNFEIYIGIGQAF